MSSNISSRTSPTPPGRLLVCPLFTSFFLPGLPATFAPCASPAQSLSALCLPPQPQGMVVSVRVGSWVLIPALVWNEGCGRAGFARLTLLPHYCGAFGWSTRPWGLPVGREDPPCRPPPRGRLRGRGQACLCKNLHPLGSSEPHGEPWSLGHSGTPSTQEEYGPRPQGRALGGQ